MSSGTKEFYTSTYILANLDWSESSINVSDNTSEVTVSLWYKRTNNYGGSTTDYGNPFWVMIDDSWYNIGSGFSIPGYDNSWHKVGEASKTVTHSSDGSKSISIGCEHSTSGSLFNCDESWTVTLDTIPRASVPTVAPSTVLLSESQNTITVNTNRKSSSFTHTLALTVGTYTETKTGVGENTTFSIPKTVLADFPANASTIEGSIVCTTKNGSTTIGSAQTVKFTCQIDVSQEHPNIGNITLTDTNQQSAAVESSGTYIRTASNLHAVIPLSVSGSYTKLASAVVQCGNVQRTYSVDNLTSTNIIFDYQKLDATALVVTVYDQRGTSRATTRTWTLVPYQNLTVVGSVDRKTETGSQISFSIQGQCFAGSFGQTTNQITVSYQFKNHASNTYLTRQETFTFTPTGSGESTYDVSYDIGNFTVDGEEYFSYDQQYDIKITVTDLFTTATTGTLVLTKGIPVYGNGEDFFAVYGRQYLHYDRDNPAKYWDLKDGIDAILEHHAETNLMNINISTQTVNGITFTVNDDGTITANGTATSDATLNVGVSKQLDTSKTWYFSGCPSGGSSSTYYCGWEAAVVAPDYPPLIMAADTGEGTELIPLWGYPAYCPFYIVIKSGTTVSNLTFKPMIRDVRIASDVFVPPVNRDWKLMGTVSASSTYTMPITDYTELFLVAQWNESSSNLWKMTAYVPKIILSSSVSFVGASSRISTTTANDFGCVFQVSLTTVRMYQFIGNRADKTSLVTTYVYYR